MTRKEKLEGEGRWCEGDCIGIGEERERQHI